MYGMELKPVEMGISQFVYGIGMKPVEWEPGNVCVVLEWSQWNGNQAVCVWYWNETSGMGVNTCMQAGKLFAASVDLRR